MSKDRKDRLSAVIVILFAVFVFIGGYIIPQASIGGGPGPGSFPMFLGTVLMILGITLFWTAGSKKKKEEPKEASMAQDEVQDIDEPFREKAKRVVTFVVLLMLYFALMPYLGFLATSLIFGIAFMVFLYRETPKKAILPALAITIFSFLIFEIALSVPLPQFMEAIK